MLTITSTELMQFGVIMLLCGLGGGLCRRDAEGVMISWMLGTFGMLVTAIGATVAMPETSVALILPIVVALLTTILGGEIARSLNQEIGRRGRADDSTNVGGDGGEPPS